MRRAVLFLSSRRWLVLWGLLCLLPLAQPELRRTLTVQLVGHSPFYPGWGYVPLFSGSERLWQPEPMKLGEQFPGDPAIVAQAISAQAFAVPVATAASDKAGNSPDDMARRVCRDLDALSRRYPRAAWLAALRLRYSLFWMRHNRLAGELSDLNYDANRARGIASPESTGAPPNFTEVDLNAALAAAAHGARLEPDNAYFDWMAVQLLLCGRRDAQAWNFCERGAAKARYDTHEREEVHSALRLRELALGRPLLPEEINVVRLLPPLSAPGGRGMARLVAWEAIKATRRGDKRTALRIYNGFAALQVRRAQGAYRVGEMRLALSMIPVALLRGRLPTDGSLANMTMSEMDRTQIAMFRDWARRHALDDTARRQSTAFATQAIALSHYTDQLDGIVAQGRFYDGMNLRAWCAALAAFSVTALLLQQTLIAALLWLLMSVARRYFLPPSEAVERSDRNFGVFLLASVLVFLIGGAARESLRQASGVFGLPLVVDLPSGGDAAAVLFPWSALAPFFFASFLVQGMTAWRAVERQKQERTSRPDRPKTPAALAPLAFLTALCLFTVTMLFWWQTALANPIAEATLPRRVAGVNLDLPFGGRTILWAALHPLWPMSAALLGLVLGWVRWVFAAPPTRRALVLYRLQWLHHLLGAAVVMCSVSYVLLSFFALPARHAAQGDVHNLMARGDNALWQRAVGKP